MPNFSPSAIRALGDEGRLRALIAWGKTFHHPRTPDVAWNVRQFAAALEAHLGESPHPTEESQDVAERSYP